MTKCYCWSAVAAVSVDWPIFLMANKGSPRPSCWHSCWAFCCSALQSLIAWFFPWLREKALGRSGPSTLLEWAVSTSCKAQLALFHACLGAQEPPGWTTLAAISLPDPQEFGARRSCSSLSAASCLLEQLNQRRLVSAMLLAKQSKFWTRAFGWFVPSLASCKMSSATDGNQRIHQTQLVR